MPMHEQEDSPVPPMAAQDYSAANDWSGYFKAILGKGPRETLLSALDSFGQEGLVNGFAVDLAAGEGRDTLELLHRGWKVLATDSHPEAFQHLWARVAEGSRSRLSTAKVSFAQTQIPACDLVNASYALPFCEPSHFDGLWKKVVTAIRPGGRLAGQFFGERDSWASLPGRSHHSRDEIMMLLDGFDVEMMEEEESDDAPDVRNPKHWQLFHVVARKPFRD